MGRIACQKHRAILISIRQKQMWLPGIGDEDFSVDICAQESPQRIHRVNAVGINSIWEAGV